MAIGLCALPAATAHAADHHELTVEGSDALQQCTVAAVELRLPDSQGDPATTQYEVHSDAFDGGKALLSGGEFDDDGQWHGYGNGLYQGKAYITQPAGTYTAFARTGDQTVSVPIRVTGTADAEDREPYSYPVEPGLWVTGDTHPGGEVEISGMDEHPDLREKTITATSPAFEKPAELTYQGKSYTGRATIRDGAAPGQYPVTFTNHFGCATHTEKSALSVSPSSEGTSWSRKLPPTAVAVAAVFAAAITFTLVQRKRRRARS